MEVFANDGSLRRNRRSWLMCVDVRYIKATRLCSICYSSRSQTFVSLPRETPHVANLKITSTMEHSFSPLASFYRHQAISVCC
jgi:hypothetical protein